MDLQNWFLCKKYKIYDDDTFIVFKRFLLC